MKTSGHYWCDNPKCDDVAFGPVCQDCHRPARFVPDAPPEPKLPTEKPQHPKHFRLATEIPAEQRQSLWAGIYKAIKP